MPRRARRSLAVIAALVLAAQRLLVAQPGVSPLTAYDTWIDQPYARAPADNPLKGFVPYEGRYATFPYSLEYKYVPWKDVQTSDETFTWTEIDRMLQDVASRGHQAIFRIYSDSPNKPYALPAFLSKVRKHSYRDFENGVEAKSYSPDYDNKRLVRAMLKTIHALGQRYDGDPRIGFVAIGFVGFWGEWHTYRRDSCRCNPWMPSPATQTAIVNAFTAAFTRTKLVLRYPDVGWSGQPVGFHDDSFAYETVDPPAWKFAGRMKAAGATDQWQTQPIGGELYPQVQSCTFRDGPCNPAGEDFRTSLNATHASWLVNQFAFEKGYTGTEYRRAVAGARRLGYELFVNAARIGDPAAAEGFSVDVRMENRGAAPFYYDWTVQLGLLAEASHRIVATYDTFWQLTQVIPGDAAVAFSHRQMDRSLPPGTYTLLMRAVNPLANGKPLVFANKAWGRDAAGWLTLGTFEIAGQPPARR